MNLFIIGIILFGLIIGYLTTTGTKSQHVRLIDIFILGPLMIYLGMYKYKNIDKNDNIIKIMSIILIFFGSTTITYNLKNYIKINKETL
jgi:hypothetical protein